MKKTNILLAVVIIIAVCFVWFMATRNHVVNHEEEVNLWQSNVETVLQRRADLIPNLVETAKGYAKHEQAVFTAIAEARASLSSSIQSGDLEKIAQANGELDASINQFLAVAENYPELKSDQHFMALMDELSGTENRISVARQYYNEAVQKYNKYIRKWPQLIWGFKQLPYFEADESAHTVPSVNFD